jgi:hypothetical protein
MPGKEAMRSREPEPADRPTPGRQKSFPGEAARQGRIVLNTPARRAVFFGGLAALALFALLMAILA